jgi:purine-binding chemotaxis protein CheW
VDIAKIRKKKKKLKETETQKAKETSSGENPDTLNTVTEKSEQNRASFSPPQHDNRDRVEKIDQPLLPDDEIDELSDQKDITEILAFKVANEEYAVRLNELQEIIKNQNITSIPSGPHYLIGVTSLRGKILPVVDLKIRLGLSGTIGEKKKIIILNSGKEPLGALVGSVSGVFKFLSRDLLPPPSTLTETEKRFIEGVARINDTFISILNVGEITKVEVL